MRHLNDFRLTRHPITSGYSIRKLLRQRWFVVALALAGISLEGLEVFLEAVFEVLFVVFLDFLVFFLLQKAVKFQQPLKKLNMEFLVIT